MKFRNFIYLFFFLMLTWLAFTSTFDFQKLMAGVIICLVLSLFLYKNYTDLGLPPLGIRRIILFVIYLSILGWETAKANIDVAYRVLHPRMPIRPGIVVIRTGLKQDIAKLMLANSITLTPGTFTLDILGDKLLIHWINVKSGDVDQASQIIAGKFEKYLSLIFHD